MPRLLNIKLLIFSLVVWMTLGCKKDTLKPPSGNPSTQEECHDYVFDGGEIFDTYITTGPQFARPFFNPTNGDEFVYVRSGTSTFTELVKHKISTGQETILCNSIMIPGQPQWGRSGWIIFDVLGNTTWKIKADGSQLSQISPSGQEAYNPVLNYAGDRLTCSGMDSYSNIYDLSFNVVDTLKSSINNVYRGLPFGSPIDFKNGVYSYSNHITNKTGVCRLINNETIEILTILEDLPNGAGIMSAQCGNNYYAYYVRHGEGLYKVDLETKQTQKLMDNCQSRYIMSLSMSADGKKVIYERVRGHQTTPGGMVIDEQSEIYLYNTITGQETKVVWEE